MSKLVEIKQKFFDEVNKKPSWGREQIKDLYRDVLVNILTGEKEDEKKDSTVSA